MNENTDGRPKKAVTEGRARSLANLRPWKKGQPSPNPKGRPKTPSFRKLIQDLPELTKQQVVDRVFAIVQKGRPGDAIRAAEWLAKHSADPNQVSVETTDFSITIAPSNAMQEEEEDDDA